MVAEIFLLQRRLLVCRERQIKGVFRFFHRGEKGAQLGPHPGSELGADISSCTPAAELQGSFTDAAGVWMQFPDVGGNFWARIQKSGGLGDGLDAALVMRQPTDAIESISCPLRSRCSHLKSGALFPLSLYLAVLVPGVWVLLMSTRLIFREMTFFVGAILGLPVDTCSASVLW